MNSIAIGKIGNEIIVKENASIEDIRTAEIAIDFRIDEHGKIEAKLVKARHYTDMVITRDFPSDLRKLLKQITGG